MKVLHLEFHNDSTTTKVVGAGRVSTHKRSVNFVPCVHVFNGDIPGVGARVLPRIEYKPILLLEHKGGSVGVFSEDR